MVIVSTVQIGNQVSFLSTQVSFLSTGGKAHSKFVCEMFLNDPLEGAPGPLYGYCKHCANWKSDEFPIHRWQGSQQVHLSPLHRIPRTL